MEMNLFAILFIRSTISNVPIYPTNHKALCMKKQIFTLNSSENYKKGFACLQYED